MRFPPFHFHVERFDNDGDRSKSTSVMVTAFHRTIDFVYTRPVRESDDAR